MVRLRIAMLALLIAGTWSLTGCGNNQVASVTKPTTTEPSKAVTPPADEVAVERAKLDPTDRALVDAQEWCVINTDERLGSMGAPIKLDIKGQAVFICCKSCKKKAEADPDKTLAKLAELKAKKKG